MGNPSVQRVENYKEGESMKIKYIHYSEPEAEKVYDTERAFKNSPSVFKTQEEFDTFELKHFAEDKVRGIIISYEIIKEELK